MAKSKPESNRGHFTALERFAACRKSGATTLSLSGLGLRELPPEIGQLTALTSLDLRFNQLSALPPVIGQLTALTSLDLRSNQLSELPPEIGRLTSLTSLWLDNNQLRVLPPEIGQLIALTSLDLDTNELSVLPPEIGRLTALTSLELDNNQLSVLPPEIGQLTALASLNLESNQLSVLPPEIGLLTALTSLNLFNNELSVLPPEIALLTALTLLDLRHNQLSVFPQEIYQLTALTSLNLESNQLSVLPPEIGQLTALVQLDVRENQLTSLPESLAQITSLMRLMITGNPIPDELLKLSGGKNGDGTKLLQFLRARATDGSIRAAPTAHRRFDEAKLLLVGPANVGKSWLLHALQGREPRKIDSTKGIEIARVPMDVLHPTDVERKLHLTCWDFGGQEHFQVTNQIFFSEKAVYLLVWKPREGFDPEMEARLERIQLSAGKSAKVLIVSTHADGIVPAVIGHDALKQRFGDLIWGFYEVDSAKGADGTGIAALKLEIAKAAAQLDGMDLDYPPSWHAAQTAIRQINAPAVTFKEIVQLCEQRGIDADTADTLAILLDVQGHAVYFPEAATDEEAGALADENIVVLDPEWLAKAVGFVIEDKGTGALQGILRHHRLADIWKADSKRGCPGYQPELRGYLLWLMWKFHIAYRQDAETSLVPELIMRNRPDDILWTPQTPAHDSEIRAVCVMTAEDGKVIAFPKGLMPALTAAIHPLRRRRTADDHDVLDRNWNNGFFLSTQERGAAYLELLDRELTMVVRHGYPESLLTLIQRTIENLVPTRWPHAKPELRVPCLGKIKGKPCPGIFKKSWLEKLNREGTITCQYCERDDLKVEELLHGFRPRDAEIMAKLHDLKEGQQDLLAAAYAIFTALDPENQERTRGPSLFTILPEKAGWLRGMAFDHVRLTCWCEHPDGPHPASPIGSNQPADYVLSLPKDWLVTASPYISWAVTLLKAFTPLANDGVGLIAGSAPGMDIKDAVAAMKEMATALPAGKLEVGTAHDTDFSLGRRWHDEHGFHDRPELVALKHIHDLLEEQIPKQQRWGTLRPVRTKTGDILWLCAQHAAIQSPPPQQI